MIYRHPYFDSAITTCNGKVNTIVIENTAAFAEILRDIASSIEGNSEQSVLFDRDKMLSFSASAELLSSFFPFELNRKTMLNKITASLEKEALLPENYQMTMKMISSTELYLSSLAEAFDCNLMFGKISPSSIIKASGLEIVEDYTSLPEKLLDYFELVREFEREKVFFTVNLRSFLNEQDVESFFESIVLHDFSVIMFENKEYSKNKWEKRLILDEDWCII